MTPSKLDSSGKASFSCSQSENGFLSSDSLLNSEKAVQELLQESPVRGSDDHLIECSEAMRAVAKALRHAAKGKAFAQAEAAEWKHKYELERMQNLLLEHKGKELCEKHRNWWTQSPVCNAMGIISIILPCLLCGETSKDSSRRISEDDITEQSLKEHCSDDERMETLASQSSMQTEYSCGRNGICSHEVLRDGKADSDPNFLHNNKFMRKASFKLPW